MTSGVGTPLYMAPEIKDLNKRTLYTSKVDIYALGIILFELIQKMTTSHERFRLIKDMLHNRIIPENLS